MKNAMMNQMTAVATYTTTAAAVTGNKAAHAALMESRGANVGMFGAYSMAILEHFKANPVAHAAMGVLEQYAIDSAKTAETRETATLVARGAASLRLQYKAGNLADEILGSAMPAGHVTKVTQIDIPGDRIGNIVKGQAYSGTLIPFSATEVEAYLELRDMATSGFYSNIFNLSKMDREDMSDEEREQIDVFMAKNALMLSACQPGEEHLVPKMHVFCSTLEDRIKLLNLAVMVQEGEDVDASNDRLDGKSIRQAAIELSNDNTLKAISKESVKGFTRGNKGARLTSYLVSSMLGEGMVYINQATMDSLGIQDGSFILMGKDPSNERVVIVRAYRSSNKGIGVTEEVTNYLRNLDFDSDQAWVIAFDEKQIPQATLSKYSFENVKGNEPAIEDVRDFIASFIGAVSRGKVKSSTGAYSMSKERMAEKYAANLFDANKWLSIPVEKISSHYVSALDENSHKLGARMLERELQNYINRDVDFSVLEKYIVTPALMQEVTKTPDVLIPEAQARVHFDGIYKIFASAGFRMNIRNIKMGVEARTKAGEKRLVNVWKLQLKNASGVSFEIYLHRYNADNTLVTGGQTWSFNTPIRVVNGIVEFDSPLYAIVKKLVANKQLVAAMQAADSKIEWTVFNWSEKLICKLRLGEEKQHSNYNWQESYLSAAAYMLNTQKLHIESTDETVDVASIADLNSTGVTATKAMLAIGTDLDPVSKTLVGKDLSLDPVAEIYSTMGQVKAAYEYSSIYTTENRNSAGKLANSFDLTVSGQWINPVINTAVSERFRGMIYGALNKTLASAMVLVSDIRDWDQSVVSKYEAATPDMTELKPVHNGDAAVYSRNFLKRTSVFGKFDADGNKEVVTPDHLDKFQWALGGKDIVCSIMDNVRANMKVTFGSPAIAFNVETALDMRGIECMAEGADLWISADVIKGYSGRNTWTSRVANSELKFNRLESSLSSAVDMTFTEIKEQMDLAIDTFKADGGRRVEIYLAPATAAVNEGEYVGEGFILIEDCFPQVYSGGRRDKETTEVHSAYTQVMHTYEVLCPEVAKYMEKSVNTKKIAKLLAAAGLQYLPVGSQAAAQTANAQAGSQTAGAKATVVNVIDDFELFATV